MRGTGGTLLAEALKEHGIDTLFTLTGGHLFPVYDACVKAGIRLVDTRQEQTAAFAAEGLAKLTRRPAVAAVTAGPGVTNAMSALATAQFNGSPMLLLGGRAPQARWGQGSLQEVDHLPLVRPLTKYAATVLRPEAVPGEVQQAMACATIPHRGPVFLDVPLDTLVTLSRPLALDPLPTPPERRPDDEALARVAELLAAARAPVLMAGSDVYWDEAWEPLLALARRAALPICTNGMARGTVPTDHPLALSRARSAALKGADLVLVAGTPLDFRLGFGRFGTDTSVVHLADSPRQISRHVPLAASASGNLGLIFEGLGELLPRAAALPDHRRAWATSLRGEEETLRQQDEALLGSPALPIHPARIHGELRRRLGSEAVVIGDGGDFVSFAGKYLDAGGPGRWLDPGPFGCLGVGMGYAIAARLAHPDAPVVLLAGDGALGFSVMDFDTLVRHKLPVVVVCGNNGAWGLEKHPMEALYGYSVAADLRRNARYDRLAQSLGGKGLLVNHPDDLGPALDQALASDRPTLINVLTDPKVAYPRRANLA